MVTRNAIYGVLEDDFETLEICQILQLNLLILVQVTTGSSLDICVIANIFGRVDHFITCLYID